MALTEDDARNLARAMNELEATTGKQDATQRLFNARMDQATKAVGASADAFITYNKEIYKGASVAKASVAANEKMAEAAVAAAAGLALLTPGGPVVKALIAGIGLLTAKLIGLGNEAKLQTEEIYKAFQQLSKVGATGATGMQGVFDSLQKVGLGTEKFGEYIKLISDNSRDLATIGGTVKKGSDMFTQAMSELTDEHRVQLEVLVGDRTAQAEAAMGYIKTQRLLTAGTKQQMDMSSTAVMRYIKETDELTRLTGLNRQDQEKQREDAMRQEAFRATINELINEGKTDEAKNIQAVNAMLAAYPQQQKAFQAQIGDFVGTTQEAAGQFLLSGGASAEFANDLRSGVIKTMPEVLAGFKKFGTSIGNGAEQFSQLAKMNAFSANIGIDFAESLDVSQRAAKLSVEDFIKVQQDQNGALAAGQKMAKAENDTRETQLRLQQELNKAMGITIDAMGKTAEENRKIVEKFGKLPISPTVNAFENLLDVVVKLADLLRPFVENVLVKGISAVADTANNAIDGVSALISGKGLSGFDRAGGNRAAGRIAGAAGGAALGSMVFPGVGTAIGAVGGYLAGDKFMQGFEQLTGTGPNAGLRGLRMKQGDVHRPGADLSPNLITLARQIQETIPGFNYFSSFNDQAHANKSSRHKDGLAADFTIGTPPTVEEGRKIISQLKSLGASYVLDEYNFPSAGATGGHFHVEVPKFEAGGNLRGIGLVGEKGPELAVGSGSITSNNDIMGAFRDMISLLEQNQMALRDIANNSKSTSDTSDQMLRIAQN